MKETKQPETYYARRRKNVERVARHWNLDAQKCWLLSKNTPGATESYRQIAHSLKTRVEA